jgi:putative addiction module component (TIGR02574 family)
MATETADVIDLALEKMTVEQKLALLEKIWASILPPLPKSSESIKELLDRRIERIKSGEAKVSDWEEAKKRLQSICK